MYASLWLLVLDPIMIGSSKSLRNPALNRWDRNVGLRKNNPETKKTLS
jgi:hypothetical protein